MSVPPWVVPFRAAIDRNKPSNRLAVATVSPDGLPAVRIVILRGFSEDGTLWFLSHLHSDKLTQLEVNPNVELLAWFEGSREQFRLGGKATVHGAREPGLWANVRHSLWAQLKPEEQVLYLGGPPGRPLGPAPQSVVAPASPPAELVLVAVEVTRVDWLRLGQPHERRLFRRLGPTAWIEEPVYP